MLPLLVSLAAPKDLAAYLVEHPWNVAANGPLLVLEPERARAGNEGAGLSAYGRRKATVGGLTALVPPTRIDIDDTFREKPNLYEGLPADAKATYLLRSLSPGQWQIASGRGLGFGDLQGEQRLVYESLLPRRFAWRANRLDAVGFWGESAGEGVLDDAERARVRLRVERTVEIQANLLDGSGTVFWGTDRYHGAPNTVTYRRDDADDMVPTGAYGVTVRKIVPNLPKPSDLDSRGAAFSGAVTLARGTTVGEIVRAAGRTAGVEIVPDFRVADRKVLFEGGKASARDLLAAVALSVEGTYRRVGSDYVLTSDLAGMGARKLRIAAWETRLRNDTQRRMDGWREEIGGREGYAAVGFGTDGPEVGATARKAIRAGDEALSRAEAVDVASLGPELGRFLDQWDKEYTQQPIRKDKVSISSNLAYRFVLPDDRPLDVEGTLGPAFAFRKREPQPAQEEGPQPPYMIPGGTRLSFLFAAETPAEGAEAVRAAARSSGGEVWLLTRSKATLVAAAEAAKPLGVKVGFAARPWRWPTEKPDRNVAGEFGPRLRETLGPPEAYGPDLRADVGTWMAPMDSAVEGAWRTFRDLSATPGVVGTMLLETQPFGYEAERAEWRRAVGPLEWASVSHGYTEGQRLLFLRAEGVDPVDIGDAGYWTTPDLRQTYFFDDGLRGMPSTYDGTDDTNPKTREVASRWRKALADLNRKAIERLGAGLSGPILFEQRLPNLNSLGSPEAQALIVPWGPGAPLPVTQGRGVSPPNGPYLVRFVPGVASRVLPPLSWLLLNPLPDGKGQMLLDFAEVPPAKLDASLRHWLVPPVAVGSAPQATEPRSRVCVWGGSRSGACEIVLRAVAQPIHDQADHALGACRSVASGDHADARDGPEQLIGFDIPTHLPRTHRGIEQ